MILVTASPIATLAMHEKTNLTRTKTPPKMADESVENDQSAPETLPLSKRAQKRLVKQKHQEEKKAARKAAEKERRRLDLERRRREWEAELAAAPDEGERTRLVESRRAVRRERVEKRAGEREARIGRLRAAAGGGGQRIAVDLDFAGLMTPAELSSLAQQIMYCYSVNGRCASPAHLWLTGCHGDVEVQLKKVPGFEKWIIERENRPYIEALQDEKANLVYLTADAETVVDELDPKKIYIIGGLVDRNRWKGITMKKAADQGIQSARLPITTYLKMSSSQVLTVNQVFEILLKFLETKDWKTAFFKVIPPRKISESGEVAAAAADDEGDGKEDVEDDEGDIGDGEEADGGGDDEGDVGDDGGGDVGDDGGGDVGDEIERKRQRIEQSIDV